MVAILKYNKETRVYYIVSLYYKCHFKAFLIYGVFNIAHC